MDKATRIIVVALGGGVLVAVATLAYIKFDSPDAAAMGAMHGDSAGIFTQAMDGKNFRSGAAFPPGGMPANFPAGRTAAASDIDIQKLDSASWKARGKDPLRNPDLVRIFDQLMGNHSAAPSQALGLRIQPEYLLQAQKLFDQYQRYKDDTAKIKGADIDRPPSEILDSVVTARLRLQQKYFSAVEIAGLFSDDNQYDAFTIERLRTKERTDLSDAQKQEQMARFANQLLSAEQRLDRQAALLPVRIVTQNASMDSANMSASQRLEMRAAAFGAEAAARMAEVDRHEAEWQNRIAQLAKVEPAMEPHMRVSMFTAAEQLRLDAALALHRSQQAQGVSNKP